MKKVLLSVIAVCISLSVFAQAQRATVGVTNHHPLRSAPKQIVDAEAQVTIPYRYTAPNEPNPSASVFAVGRTFIATSTNVYGLLVPTTSPVAYNAALGATTFTCRSGSGGSGKIRFNVSTDGGTTWDTSRLAITLSGAGPSLGRYPSGAIINPAGNTTLANAFAVVAGPATDLAPGDYGWVSHYFGAKKLDAAGSNAVELYTYKYAPGAIPGTPGGTPNTVVTEGSFATINYGSLDNAGRYRVADNASDSAGSSLYADMNGVMIATYTRDEVTNTFSSDFKVVSSGNILHYESGGMAWSENGQVGYTLVAGIDTTSAAVKKPNAIHVWKTTNAGATWAKLPDFDFTSILGYTFNLSDTTLALPGNFQIFPKTIGGAGGTRPFFLAARYTAGQNYDMVVDKQNELHIFAPVIGGATNNVDSLNFTWNVKQQLFDTYTSSTTGKPWQAKHIAELQTEIVPDASSPITGFGYEHRIQASRTTDGQYVVCSWIDTDASLDSLNLYPNIFAWAMDVSANKVVDTAINLTAGSNFDSDNFWYAASHTVVNDGTKLTIPATVGVPTAAGSAIKHFNHFYVNGLEIPLAAINTARGVATKELSKGFSLTPAYPNPATNNSIVGINLDAASTVGVTLSNVIGQVLYTNSSRMDAGNQQITLNTSGYAAGVYFYTVTVNGNNIVNKLIVK